MYFNADKAASPSARTKAATVSVPIVCFVILYSIYLSKRTYLIASNSTILNLLNWAEWPIYLFMFLSAVIKEKYRSRDLALIFGIGFILFLGFTSTGYAELLKAMMMIVALKKADDRKLFEVMYRVLVVSIVLTIFLYVLGLSDAGVQRRGANALGYAQANSVGYVLMVLTLLTIARKERVSNGEKFVLAFVNLLGFIIADSRSGFLLACVALLFSNNSVYMFVKRRKFVRTILIVLPAILMAFTLLTAVLYEKNFFVQALDALFNARISMNSYLMKNIGITLLGRPIQQRGYLSEAIYNPVTQSWSNYITVDSAYLSLIVEFGLLATVVIGVAYARLMKKLFRYDAIPVAIAMTIIALYGLTESSIISIYVSFPFILLLHPFEAVQRCPEPVAEGRQGFRFVWKPPIWLDEDDGRVTGIREENVSFAVFNTLIRRSVARPADLFRIMEQNDPRVPEHFAEKRMEAECTAYAKLGTRMGLADIYGELLPLYGSRTNDLMALEIQYEIAGCRPVADNIDLVNLCMEHDKNVFLIADTYLPSSVLRRMLDVCGVYHYDQLYVSCEEGACKVDGSLFWKVLADQEIRPHELRHIGSDRQGDVVEPWRVGVHVKRGKKKDQSTVDKDLPEDVALYERTLQSCIRNCADDLDSDDARLGCETFGPLLAGFTAWLREQLHRDGVQDVYFLAGDGAVLKQAFDALEDSSFRTHSLYFPEHTADQDHEALLAYLRACGMQGRVALVDTGRQAGVQKTLENLIAEARLNIQVKGYYVGLADTDGIQATGYLYEQGQGKETMEKLSPITAIFETVFHAQHGAVRRIAMRDGQPVPELDASEYASDEGRICDEIAILRAYQAGALTLVREMNTAFPGGVPQIPGEAAVLPLLRMGTNPTPQEAELWGDYRVFRDGKAILMARPRSMGSYLLHPGQLKRDYAASPWKIGFLRRLIRLPLAYDKIVKNG